MEAVTAVLPRQAADAQVVGVAGSGPRLRIAGRSVRALWIDRGWPAEVREALTRKPRPQLLVCPAMSPGGRAAADEAGVSWIDETGAAHVSIGTLVLMKEGTAPSPRTAATSRWTPALFATCEAVLCGVSATGHALSGATGLSLATCLKALRFLTEQGFLVSAASRGRNSGRTLHDPYALLTSYATAVAESPPTPSVVVGVLWRDQVQGMLDVGREWARADVAWAATSALAAAAMAPFQTQVSPLEVFVDAKTISGLEHIAAVAGLRPIKGGRLRLLPFPGPGTARLRVHQRSGMVTVPWPRAYADLRLTGVRGEDAAEFLREEMMGG